MVCPAFSREQAGWLVLQAQRTCALTDWPVSAYSHGTRGASNRPTSWQRAASGSLDLAGDGQLDPGDARSAARRSSSAIRQQGWDTFRAFRRAAAATGAITNLRFVDLDGRWPCRRLITEDDALHLASVAGRGGISCRASAWRQWRATRSAARA